MTVSWAYIASVLVRETLSYQLPWASHPPDLGNQLGVTWGRPMLRTQAEGWSRLS